MDAKLIEHVDKGVLKNCRLKLEPKMPPLKKQQEYDGFY